MARDDPIVISDSDSDTLSESEREVAPPLSKTRVAQAKNQRPQDTTSSAATASDTIVDAGQNGETEAGPSRAGLLGLLPDRRQLELERKERARKRRREQNLPSDSSDSETQVETKRTKGSTTASPIAAALSNRPTSHLATPKQNAELSTKKNGKQKETLTSSAVFSRATDPILPTSRFWNGTVKHGYNRYADPSSSGVSISQMLLPATSTSRNGLQYAVLATYDLRIDWLYSLFPRGLPVTLVLPPPKEDYRTDPAVARPGLHPSQVFGGDFARCSGWHICVPHKPKGGWLTQHMKFLILVHDGWMRVAILSGNLNEIDWERIENTAYIQDFPLLSASSGASNAASGKNDFKSQLVRVLRSLSLPSSHAVYDAIDRHDFSQATRARIVASWPEAASLADCERIETQGLGRLGKVVREYAIKGPVDVECQGSSLANHGLKWVEHFHVLASGVNPRGVLPLKGKPNEAHPEYFRAVGRKGAGGLPPVKVVFPRQQYVEQDTVEGPNGALSFFGKAETFGASPIKKLYHSPQSRRGDIMIHAKSILALTDEGKEVVDRAFVAATEAQMFGTPRTAATPSSTSVQEWKPNEGEKPVGWSYLGSSNFTRAAHGNISGTTAKPTMSSMNWELGVVMPIYASEVELFGVEAQSLRPIVYHRPLQAYSREDTPWDNTTALAELHPR